MRYKDILINDTIDGERCITLILQDTSGIPFGGRELQYIKRAFYVDKERRTLNIKGDKTDPMNTDNFEEIKRIIRNIKFIDENLKVYVQTKYPHKELLKTYSDEELCDINLKGE